MDLAAIKGKLKLNAYECIEECLNDIECIYHNCFVGFSGECEDHFRSAGSTQTAIVIQIQFLYCSYLYKLENHVFTLAAAKLLEFCSNEIKFMNDCANCYENSCKLPIDCVMACDLPHLVVWTNISDYKFWPSEKGFRYFGFYTCFTHMDLVLHTNSQNAHTFLHRRFQILAGQSCSSWKWSYN